MRCSHTHTHTHTYKSGVNNGFNGANKSDVTDQSALANIFNCFQFQNKKNYNNNNIFVMFGFSIGRHTNTKILDYKKIKTRVRYRKKKGGGERGKRAVNGSALKRQLSVRPGFWLGFYDVNFSSVCCHFFLLLLLFPTTTTNCFVVRACRYFPFLSYSSSFVFFLSLLCHFTFYAYVGNLRCNRPSPSVLLRQMVRTVQLYTISNKKINK